MWNLTPTLLLHGVLFYVNRYRRQQNIVMSCCASFLSAATLAAELPFAYVGLAWILLGLTLFEIGLRKGLSEFQMQAEIAFAAGLVATILQTEPAPLAISLIVVYGCALRTARLPLFSLGFSGATTVLASGLALRLVSQDYLSIALWVIAIAALELGSRRLPATLRGFFAPLAILAAVAGMGSTWDITKFAGASVWLTCSVACLMACLATLRLTLRPSEATTNWERSTLRDRLAGLACAAGFALTWSVTPDSIVTALWTAIAVGACETGIALRVRSFRIISLVALAATYLRVFLWDLNHSAPAALVAIAGGYWLWHRSRQAPFLDEETETIARIQFWSAMIPVVAFLACQLNADSVPVGWVALANLLVALGNRFAIPDARLQAYALSGLALAGAMAYCLEPAHLCMTGLTIAGLYAIQQLAKRSAEQWASASVSIAGTLLLSSVLYFQASGGMLTIFWGLQGLALLGCGFALRERILRWQALCLLLTCVLKLFLYDLGYLETIYRIFSFIALGLILLSVSWVYTRFRPQLRTLL